jgi:hypothetical protein
VFTYRLFQLVISALLGAPAFVLLRGKLMRADRPAAMCAPLALDVVKLPALVDALTRTPSQYSERRTRRLVGRKGAAPGVRWPCGLVLCGYAGEAFVDEAHDHCSLADGGGDAFGRA